MFRGLFMFKVSNLQPSFLGSSFSFIAWGKKNLIFFHTTQTSWSCQQRYQNCQLHCFQPAWQLDAWLYTCGTEQWYNKNLLPWFHTNRLDSFLGDISSSSFVLSSSEQTNICNKHFKEMNYHPWKLSKWLSFSHTTSSLFLPAASINFTGTVKTEYI